MAIGDLVSAASAGIDFRTLSRQGEAAATAATSASSTAAENPTTTDSGDDEASMYNVAVRSSTGQARISNALTRADAIALYRELAGKL